MGGPSGGRGGASGRGGRSSFGGSGLGSPKPLMSGGGGGYNKDKPSFGQSSGRGFSSSSSTFKPRGGYEGNPHNTRHHPLDDNPHNTRHHPVPNDYPGSYNQGGYSSSYNQHDSYKGSSSGYGQMNGYSGQGMKNTHSAATPAVKPPGGKNLQDLQSRAAQYSQWMSGGTGQSAPPPPPPSFPPPPPHQI